MTSGRADLEDLSVLYRRGLLTEAEEREFERALRASPALRAVHQVGVEMDASTAVRAGDEALVARVADSALARVAASGLAPRKSLEKGLETGRVPGPRSGFVRRRPRWASLAVAAAFVFLAGGAAAVLTGVVRAPWLVEAPGKVEARPEVPPPLAARSARAAAPPSVAAPAVVSEPEMPPPAPAAPPVAASGRPLPVRAMPGETAASLFSAANAARRDGDFSRAKRHYSDLIARYPASDEARLARVSLGKLLLARGNASDAAHEFDEYLKSGRGQLAEEALVNRAQSLQKLGDRQGERRTWEGLLSGYPNSVYSAEARRRLSALSPGGAGAAGAREATSSAP